MPYIHPGARADLADGDDPCTQGELNYVITKLILERFWKSEPWSYSKFNEVIGVLECVKLEFYRRMVAPYEDGKCKENGDVYA